MFSRKIASAFATGTAHSEAGCLATRARRAFEDCDVELAVDQLVRRAESADTTTENEHVLVHGALSSDTVGAAAVVGAAATRSPSYKRIFTPRA